MKKKNALNISGGGGGGSAPLPLRTALTVRRGGVGAGLDIPRSLVSNETAGSQPELKFFFQLGLGSNDKNS